MSSSGYPKFRNDRGVPEICIGVKEFMCIGESPPQDHPHVYINMGEAGTILCPYCATRFRFDPRLTASDADPPDSFFADHNAAWAERRHGTGPIALTRFGRHEDTPPPLATLAAIFRLGSSVMRSGRRSL